MKIISDIEIIDNILSDGEYIVNVDNNKDDNIEGSYYVIKFENKFYYVIVDVENYIISEGIRCFEMGYIFKNEDGDINFDINENYIVE